MTVRKRSGPRTVLDDLVSSGVVDPSLAEHLRRFYSEFETKTEPFVGDDASALAGLVNAVMQPSQRRVREARLRAMGMALEHARYVAQGETAATKRTAENCGVTRRAVNNAVRRFPNISIKPSYKRDPRLRKLIRAFHEAKMPIQALGRKRKHHFVSE
jgi:hypothetical protein